MFVTRRSWVVFVALAMGLFVAAAMAQPTASPQSLWADFNHYVRIARPDLASASASALLNQVNDQQLLEIVEAAAEQGDNANWQDTLARAAKMDTLQDIAADINRRVEKARTDRARDPQRIDADIRRLGEGERARLNAMNRLRAAGQFAAPALLRALLDENQKALAPHILRAMVAVGRPVALPLSIALPDLEAVPQGQVAQVLGEIGYPVALPYLALVNEDPSTDPNSRKVVATSLRMLLQASNLPNNVTASELFLTLSQNYYSAATRGEAIVGMDEATGNGILWSYSEDTGLVPVEIPAAIFGDVLAMNASRRALLLNPNLDQALSLWLTANLRRENRLPADQQDPSYDTTVFLPPEFYIEMAGPLRQHDVLDTALLSRDSELALDAISALAATAGTDALLNRQGAVQPLIRALSFPDRQVRFAAAFAMTNARPTSDFPGAHRVVPVLAEAVRQSDQRIALILGRDRAVVNQLMSVARELQFQPVGGLTYDELATQVTAGPGADLILVNHDLAVVEALHKATAVDFRLAAVPIIALAEQGGVIELNRKFEGDARLRPALASANPEELKAVVTQATAASVGRPINAEQALWYATTALSLLRAVAEQGSSVFNVADAEPALLEALSDTRAEVPPAAAHVLALVNDPAAQIAIADAALDATRPSEVRLSLLASLAESARLYGNRLTELQVSKLLDLVKTSKGDLAVAAAQAHGALTLPTSHVVEMIQR